MSTDTTAPPTPDQDAPGGVRWHLVLPVKDAALGKSRLDAPAPLRRSDLARAVAHDTVETACLALGPGLVTVVTSDGPTREAALALGARVVEDPGQGLNAAVAAGWDDHPEAPGGRVGWAALLGDLPAARPADLRAALERCAAHRASLVPDAEGTGTVLLASTVAPPTPRFGPGSARRHEADGARRLELDLPRLRRDVDVVDDLREALALGVGRRTLLAVGRGV